MTRDCGCLGGVVVCDVDRHLAWHALVVEQGGPAGVVNAETVREARGLAGGTPGTTYFDVRVEKLGQRASGARRRAAANDG